MNHGQAVFTLSLDCEGLWGLADDPRVVRCGKINDDFLRDAYEFVIRHVRENALNATAAFVTGFAADADLLMSQRPLIEELAALHPGWYASILPAVRQGRLDGWRGASFYRSMAAAGFEMAWHGATHLSLSERTSDRAVAVELELASRMFRELGRTPRTIIFPRNEVGHLRQLREHDFTAYRTRLPNGRLDRVIGLLNECNLWDRGSTDGPELREGWRVAPAGCFLNWPSGARGLVPVAATVGRWKSILRHAVRRGGYVHMWFHPHNLVTAPAMKVAFKEIAAFAGQLIRSGDLVGLTIAEANQSYLQV